MLRVLGIILSVVAALLGVLLILNYEPPNGQVIGFGMAILGISGVLAYLAGERAHEPKA
jgi:hypothetical protein